ncbi:hypothetical protein OO013_07075 [Mangrovivirga sp. M17]|uniref:Translocation/assembly module TamB n=1 Tax=Mangrovivirga halotolerans TaxID=2993936 RepID=A0ABT3RR07_9BACT|nr:hypothetical protein [Mangrovivirga halotolerans]MCX2743620.1 hypothetical protein [Mangrovivirga halotolerans]
MPEGKTRHKKPFYRRHGVIIGFSLIILLIPFFLITKNLTKSYLYDFLEEKIAEKTDGKYQFSYSDISVSFLASKAEFKDIHLTPKDSSDFYNLKDTSNMVKILIPDLTLDVKQLILVYWTKKLEVQSIRLDSPVITIKTSGRQNSTSLSGEVGKIYNQISEYLEEFKINNLSINDANVEYLLLRDEQLWPVILDDLNLNIDDFLLNRSAVENKSKFLSADNVTFYSGPQKIFLKDSVHFVSFDSLKINTLNSAIRITDFTIQPSEDISHDEVQNLFYYNTPGLEIRNIDFNRSYQKNILDVGAITLTETTFNTKNHWVKKMISGEKSVKQDNNLSAFLSSVFNTIEVDTFTMAHGKMIFEQENGGVLHLPQMEISVYDYILDSTMISTGNYFPSYTDLGVRFFSPNYRSGNRELNFNASSIEFSSKSEILKVNKLKISKQKDGAKTPDFEAYLPEIILDGLDKTMLNKDSTVSLKEVYLNSPDFFIRSSNINKTQNKENILRDLPKAWLNAKIDNLIIDNARLEISGYRGSSSPQILTTGMKIDIDNMLWYEEMSLEESLNQATINTASTEYIILSLNNGGIIKSRFPVVRNDFNRIFIQDLEFEKPPQDSLSSDVKYIGEGIRLYRLSKNKLIKDLVISADSATIEKGNLEYLIRNKARVDSTGSVLRKKTIKGINLKAVNLKETEFNIKRDSTWHLTTPNAAFYTTDLKWNNTTDSIEFGFNKYKIDFKTLLFKHLGMGHELSADRVYSSSSSDKVIFDNLLINADNKKLNRGITINAEIPFLTANAYDLSKGINKNELSFRSIELEEPAIKIDINKKNITKKEAGKFSFSSENTSIINGSLSINLTDSSGNITKISTALINGSVSGLETLRDSTGIHWPDGGMFAFSGVDFENKDIIIKADSITTGMDPGSLVITNAEGTPKDSTKNWQANTEKISINNWDIPVLFSKKEFTAGSLVVDGVTYTKLLTGDNIQATDNSDVFNLKEEANDFIIKKFTALSKIDIDNFAINQVNFSIADPYQERLAVQGFRLGCKDLKADFTKNKDIWSYRALETGFDYFFYPLASYNIQSGYTIWNDISQTLTVTDFRIVPTLPPEILAESQNYEEDIVTLRLGETVIKDFNTLELLNDSTIVAKEIIIKNPELNIYRDKNKPVDKSENKPFPNEFVRNSPLGLNIDKITTFGGFLRYREVPENGLRPGDVILTDVSGNLSNIFSNPPDSSHMLISMQGDLMGTSKLTLDLDFNMNSEEGAFKTTIGLAPMPLPEMNAFLEPSAMIRFNSGQLDTAMVFAQGYKDNIYGNMGFYYQDMSMTLLKVNTDKEGGVQGTLGGFFANMILKKNNTEEWYKKPRYMFYERVDHRSFINFLVKASLTGIKSNMGAGRNLKFIRRFYQDEFKPEIEELKESRLKN